jgi:hypothetical protein
VKSDSHVGEDGKLTRSTLQASTAPTLRLGLTGLFLPVMPTLMPSMAVVHPSLWSSSKVDPLIPGAAGASSSVKLWSTLSSRECFVSVRSTWLVEGNC